VAVTLVAAPIGPLALCWLSYHCLFGGVIVPGPSRFLLPCASWKSQCKRKSTSKQKSKTPKGMRLEREYSPATSFPKGNSPLPFASWQLHPTFIRGKWESFDNKAAPNWLHIWVVKGVFSTENVVRSSLTNLLEFLESSRQIADGLCIRIDHDIGVSRWRRQSASKDNPRFPHPPPEGRE